MVLGSIDVVVTRRQGLIREAAKLEMWDVENRLGGTIPLSRNQE